MPPAPEIEKEQLYEHMKELDLFYDDGDLKKSVDPIWKKICKDLKLRMQPRSLYLQVYKDTYGILTKIREYQGIRVIVRKKKRKPVDKEYLPFENNNPKKCNPLNFQIRFSHGEWLRIKPHERQRQMQLKRGWTDYFYEKIIEQHKLPCAYIFKSSHVNNSNQDITFNGYCTECKTSLHGRFLNQENMDTSEDQSENGVYVFEINTYATFDVPHVKSRKVPKVRKEVKKIHLPKYGKEYKRALKNECNNYSDIVSDSVRQKCGIMKVSWKPFYVFYWTDEQVQFWNSIAHLKLPLFLDSTSDLVKNVMYNSSEEKPLFYYAMVVAVNGRIVPLWQILTTVHNVSLIQEALSMWIEQSGAIVPNEIVTDGSLALQNSVTLAFNCLTFAQYNLQCFQILIGKNVTLPACFYRSEISHLLNTLNYWECFSSADKSILQFYKTCIGYMCRLKTLMEFRRIALSVFILSMSNVAPKGSSCNSHLSFITNILKTYDFSSPEGIQSVERLTEIHNEESSDSRNELIDYVNEIYKEAKTFVSQRDKFTNTPNLYYCENFHVNFKSLCEKLPSWTNLMIDHYKSKNVAPTSVKVDTFFKHAYETEPMTATDFLLDDAEKIESLINSEISQLKQNEVLQKTQVQIHNQNELLQQTTEIQVHNQNELLQQTQTQIHNQNVLVQQAPVLVHSEPQVGYFNLQNNDNIATTTCQLNTHPQQVNIIYSL